MMISAANPVALLSLLFAATLLGLIGCGRGSQTVSGKLIRKDGTPLPSARVILRSTESGKSAYGSTDSSGQFSFDLPEDGAGSAERAYEVLIVEDSSGDEVRKATISSKYQDPRKSGLSVNVQPGNSARFEATLDPP